MERDILAKRSSRSSWEASLKMSTMHGDLGRRVTCRRGGQPKDQGSVHRAPRMHTENEWPLCFMQELGEE